MCYRTPCSGNFIAVYGGYNEYGQSHKLCGTLTYRSLYVTGSYAYIKFHTNSKVNSKKLRGFSRVVFTAQGMPIAIRNRSLRNHTVSDINECRLKYCDHSCVNLVGSYKCSCKEGYYLAGTRRCFGKLFTLNVTTV